MSIFQDLLKDIPTSVHGYFNDIEAEAKILRFLQKRSQSAILTQKSGGVCLKPPFSEASIPLL